MQPILYYIYYRQSVPDLHRDLASTWYLDPIPSHLLIDFVPLIASPHPQPLLQSQSLLYRISSMDKKPLVISSFSASSANSNFHATFNRKFPARVISRSFFIFHLPFRSEMMEPDIPKCNTLINCASLPSVQII